MNQEPVIQREVRKRKINFVYLYIYTKSKKKNSTNEPIYREEEMQM